LSESVNANSVYERTENSFHVAAELNFDAEAHLKYYASISKEGKKGYFKGDASVSTDIYVKANFHAKADATSHFDGRNVTTDINFNFEVSGKAK
jgi:hypothetical protein